MSLRKNCARPHHETPATNHCSEILFAHCPIVLKGQRLASEIERLQAELESLKRDIASLREEEVATRHSAEHDDLTGLPNRAYFVTCLEAGLHQQRIQENGLAVFFMDVDHFKDVNDRYGHAAGDALLRIVATRLNRAMRKNDIVCRLGGDEFACLLKGMRDRPQLARLARKLLASIATPCNLNGVMVDVHISIGIATSTRENLEGHNLLALADEAMYTAKRSNAGFAFSEL
ncbi:COG2199 c-di-GMP synthetase (diguanylate cyclase, GGDEF domain) [Comamonadaceae bacterium]